MTRVLLCDDQQLLRETLALLINATEGLEVVAQAANGEQAIAMAIEHQPDIILMDLRMPVMDGITATQHITTNPTLEHTRVLVLTTYETNDMIVQALRAGASGFLGKGVPPAKLLEAIHTITDGDALLSPAATRTLIEHVLTQPNPRPHEQPTNLTNLTDRETEVVTLVGLGLSNHEIAEHLTISPLTAKTHVNRAMTKLHARDRAQLVIAAYENNLVTPNTRP